MLQKFDVTATKPGFFAEKSACRRAGFRDAFSLRLGKYEMLEAPHKEYIAFHETAHVPVTDEPDLFAKIMKEKLLG